MRKIYFTLLFILLLPALSFASIEDSQKYAALVIDQTSQQILYQKHAKARRYPASLVKAMTAYMVFEALEQRKITMDTKLRVSKEATLQEPVSLYLKEGQTISVKDALNALIVKSANDVAVVIAEGLSRTESQFALKMTKRARQLGMQNTVFTNASGLPNKNQYTNAVDMVKLAIALQRDFPQYFYLFGQTQFPFRGKTIRGHNRVLAEYPSATGLKTGLTKASGRNIITTTSSEMGNLVAVVFGAGSVQERDNHMIGLLDKSYQKLIADANYSKLPNRNTRSKGKFFANSKKMYKKSPFENANIKKIASGNSGFKPLNSTLASSKHLDVYDSYTRLEIAEHEFREYNALAFDAVSFEKSPFKVLQ